MLRGAGALYWPLASLDLRRMSGLDGWPSPAVDERDEGAASRIVPVEIRRGDGID
jgi:hypothetical protein